MSPAVEIYRLLLRLYPPKFRRRFETEMMDLFRRRLATSTVGQFWLSVAQDFVRTLPAAWFGFASSGMQIQRLAFAASSSMSLAERLVLLLRDLRFAVRSLRRTPRFTIVAIATLGLGVGANAAMFSVVNGVMLVPLPFPEPEQLFVIWRTEADRASTSLPMSQPDIRDIQSEVRALRIAGFDRSDVTVTGDGEPAVVNAARVTDGLFDILGAAPLLGRDIRTEENVPGGPRVVVVGHAFWQERLGGRPDVVGTTVELSGRLYEVVGVAPPEFTFPSRSQLWLPRYLDTDGCGRGCHLLAVIARLESQTEKQTVQVELNSLAARLRSAYPEDNYDKDFRIEPLTETVYGRVRTGLLVLLGAVGIVLLIACANVANLLLVRASSRTGEIAVRAALGASRRQLVVQFMLEAMVLAAFGGLVGIALARVGLEFMLRLAPSALPRVDTIAIDGTVLLFALGTVTLIIFLFGLAPALRLSRVPVAHALNARGRGDGGSSPSWARSTLLVAEVAMSLMLLSGAGLLLRTFSELSAVELGFDHERVLTFGLTLPAVRYETPDDRVRFIGMLEERLHALPEVESVGGAIGSPMSGSSLNGGIRFLDRPVPPPGQMEVELVRIVTPGYLGTLRIPLLRGRNLEPSDRAGELRVALITEAFAARHYPDKDPLGEQFRLYLSLGYPENQPRTIVGIVSDIHSRGVRTEPEPEIYVPHAQSGASFLRMVVRVRQGARNPLAAVRQEVRQLDPNLALRDVVTLSSDVEDSFGDARFYLTLLIIFAGVAVVLAAIGLYGVVAYVVSLRTHEIGIRMALGATSGKVVRLVLNQSMGPAGLGIVLGLAGTFASSRVLTSLLFNVAPRDPTTLTAVTALLLGVVTIAILVPANRSSRIPPAEALRLDR